jgi:hypothetical protein
MSTTMNRLAVRSMNYFPFNGLTPTEVNSQWPDSELTWVYSLGARNANVCAHIEGLTNASGQPHVANITTLGTILSRFKAKLKGDVILALHHGYEGATVRDDFVNDTGTYNRRNMWQLYHSLSANLPTGIHLSLPNELVQEFAAHNETQKFLYSAVRDAKKNRFLWLSPAMYWSADQLKSGGSFRDYFRGDSYCGWLSHIYEDTDTAFQPPTLVNSVNRKNLISNDFLDLQTFASLERQRAAVTEWGSFTAADLAALAARKTYMEEYMGLASECDMDIYYWHADMLLGTTPGSRSIPY